MKCDIRHWSGNKIPWLEPEGTGTYRTVECENGNLYMEYHSEAFSDGIDCWLHLGITKAFWYDNDDYTDFTLPELIEELHLVEES